MGSRAVVRRQVAGKRDSSVGHFVVEGGRMRMSQLKSTERWQNGGRD